MKTYKIKWAYEREHVNVINGLHNVNSILLTITDIWQKAEFY